MREDWFEIVSTSLALLFGFPTIILCICYTKAMYDGNSSLNTPFFNIFMIAGINDIAVFLLNLVSTRLPGTGLFNPLLISISSGPIPTTTMFLFYLTSYAQIYGALIITLNRFTAVAFPTIYVKIWSRISVLCIVMMFVLPLSFCWNIIFHGAVFEVYDHPFVKFIYNKPIDQEYISKGVNVTYSICVVSFINLAFNLGSLCILFHRRKKKHFIKSQKVEFNLYITTLVLFALQILIAIQQVFQKLTKDPMWQFVLIETNPLLSDLNSLCPLWLLTFASRAFRLEIRKMFGRRSSGLSVNVLTSSIGHKSYINNAGQK